MNLNLKITKKMNGSNPGHDYVTSRSDEGFTLPDPTLTRSWSLLQNQT